MMTKAQKTARLLLASPTHPVWALLRTFLLASSLLFFLWLNASSFDENEVTILLQVLLATFGIEIFQNRILSYQKTQYTKEKHNTQKKEKEKKE